MVVETGRRPTGRAPLPAATSSPDAVIRVFAARTVRWRSIFAVHTWIVVKKKGATSYTRYDYTAWGEPIRTNGFAPDGRWFGAVPETVVAIDGNTVRLGISAPAEIGIYREEVWQRVCSEGEPRASLR